MHSFRRAKRQAASLATLAIFNHTGLSVEKGRIGWATVGPFHAVREADVIFAAVAWIADHVERPVAGEMATARIAAGFAIRRSTASASDRVERAFITRHWMLHNFTVRQAVVVLRAVHWVFNLAGSWQTFLGSEERCINTRRFAAIGVYDAKEAHALQKDISH